MTELSLKPAQASKRLLSVLPDRAQDVLSKRFGLGREGQLTLEAIGQEYGITRERVRQIENFALASIRKSDAFAEEEQSFRALHKALLDLGGVLAEEDLLDALAKDTRSRNHINLLLELGDSFSRQKEDSQFRHRWVADNALAESIYAGLKKIHDEIGEEDLVPERELIRRFLRYTKDVPASFQKEECARRWLSISRRVAPNPLGDWGLADSPNVRARGMRDYAFLVIRKHGNPMHFREVVEEIEHAFGKKAHVATCHNELIKDDRFVLVGRGMYALGDWGYASGIVRDVISSILKEHGPLTKKEIVEKVLKERYVKSNTILVNLQNPKHFRKDKDGRYHIATKK